LDQKTNVNNASNGPDNVNTNSSDSAHVPNRIKKKPLPLNAGTNTATPARKLTGGTEKPQLQRKSSLLKTSQPPTPGSATTTTTSPKMGLGAIRRAQVQPRAAKQIDEHEAMQKMKEQSEKERTRANYIRSDKDPDRERKKIERLQAKEKKDTEKEEKKKVRELEKKRKIEETEVLQRKRLKEADQVKRQPPRPPTQNMPQMPSFFNNGARPFMSPFMAMPGGSPGSSPFAMMMSPFSPTGSGVQFNVINNPTTPTSVGTNKMSQMLQDVLNQQQQQPPHTNTGQGAIPTSAHSFTPTQSLPAPPSIRFGNPNTPTSAGRMPFMYYPGSTPPTTNPTIPTGIPNGIRQQPAAHSYNNNTTATTSTTNISSNKWHKRCQHKQRIDYIDTTETTRRIFR
jgi:hypothetical protein